MAKVTGFTAERMLEIEASCVVDGEVVGGHLILEKHDGTQIDAGSTLGPPGPQGPQGVSGIPGEVRLWPNTVLPEAATYGNWVWADGEKYLIADHPIAASHIGSQWRTFGGPNFPVLPDPGAGYFRVPDLRGLVAAGLDQMPGGAMGRANRMARIESITAAKAVGEEMHKLIPAEHAKHNHGSVAVTGTISGSTAGGGHEHQVSIGNSGAGYGMQSGSNYYAGAVLLKGTAGNIFGTGGGGGHSHTVGGSFTGSGGVPDQGSDTPHENVQPTVFVPYIILLDG